MEGRIQELIRRRPSKWGNVTVKAFEQDMTLLQDTLKKELEKTAAYEKNLAFYGNADTYNQSIANQPTPIELDKGNMAKRTLIEYGSGESRNN